MTTLADYRARLRVNKHRLDDELEVQAEIQERIAREVTRLERELAISEDDYQRWKARLAEDFKRENPKATVDQVNNAVRRHSDRLKAWDKREAAQGQLREWQALLEAWKVKGFALRDLGALYSSDYFALTQTSIRGDRSVDDIEALVRTRDAIREASGPQPRRRTVINE